MVAYHGDYKIKETYVLRMRWHLAADELLQRFGYWRNGKGCAVGCTIHASDPRRYETELGIPQNIARLEDGIFEGLSEEDYKRWPLEFLEAIKPGADLTGVADLFIHWVLMDEENGVLKYAKKAKSVAAIKAVGKLYARKIKGEKIKKSKWSAAYAAASSTAFAAAHTAADDADHAAAFTAAFAAAFGADDAAYTAAFAAYAASGDADPATYRKVRKKQAERLLRLLREAPLPAAGG